MKFEKGNKFGNRFSSENQPPNRGRKPSLYKRLKQMTGTTVGYELSREDFEGIIRWALEQTPASVAGLLRTADGKQNSNTPLWLINVLSAINSDIREGKLNAFEVLMDRAFGKATTKIEGNVVMDVNADLKDMSEDELKAEVERLSEALK